MEDSKLANRLRRRIIQASFDAVACHIGSALSCVEIIIDIFSQMKEGDFFIFSKASGVAAYYAMLVEQGIIPEDKMAYYLKEYPLPSKEVPGVIFSGGSLGHGLPVAVGLALGAPDKDVYCLMSDAELQEGTTWESLLFMVQHELNNLHIYVDWNGLQACGLTRDILLIPKEFFEDSGFKIVQTTKGKGIDFMENNNDWHYLNLTPELYEEAMKQLE